MSRINNSFKNTLSGFLSKFMNIPLQLIIRYLFIKQLGVEYIGLNSLFLSTINILNMAELGFGVV